MKDEKQEAGLGVDCQYEMTVYVHYSCRYRGNSLCWLLGTSVQKIGLLYTMEQAFLPKHVR